MDPHGIVFIAAIWIGYLTMLVGGVVLLVAILGISVDYAWRKIQEAHGLKKIVVCLQKMNDEK